MVKISDAGPTKFPEHRPEQKNDPLDPANWHAPATMGKNNKGVHIDGPNGVFQALDKRGVTQTKTNEIKALESEMTIYALGQTIAEHFKNQ